ncbi:PASTA domain-containing protein [Fulvivirga lutea]|uniref:PASTA domain-containing protein n=1 Tax=Fulvivirga lutea TaxID=2810512 RepID=A0A974WLC8_9BACT|nr:PASTA domain-containing protein [Fulvivirga lutea]
MESDTIRGFLIQLGIAIVILIGSTLYFFYGYLPAFTNHGESITVPNLEGIQMKDLEDFLLKRNLRYEVNDSSYSEKHPPLTILKQYPKPGSRVKENRKIFVSVNRVKPPTVPVPELVDRSLRNAEAVLASNELKRGQITYRPSQFLNLVLEMSSNGKVLNEGDRIDKGSTVDLVVGNGYAQSNFKTPRLTGNTFEDAQFIILGSNLGVGLVTVEGDTVGQKSIVIKQDPEEGAEIKIGDVINLWIVPESDVELNSEMEE